MLESQVLGQRPIEMGHIDLRKVNGFWSKVDHVRQELSRLFDPLSNGQLALHHDHSIDHVYIEDPLKKFRRGSSSANTIILLARFNAVVSSMVRDITRRDPIYLDATWARKKIGIKLQLPKKCGKGHKEQTFEQLCESTFKGVDWPKKKSGAIQDFCGDEVDSYVICLAGIMSGGAGEQSVSNDVP